MTSAALEHTLPFEVLHHINSGLDCYCNAKNLPSIVAHYCNTDTLYNITEKDKHKPFWATSCHFLNDISEFVGGLEWIQIMLAGCGLPDEFKSFTQSLIDHARAPEANTNSQINCFVLSFSTKRDNLGQWRGYGNNGSGVSLEYESELLRDSMFSAYCGHVVYSEGEKEGFALHVIQSIHKMWDRYWPECVDPNADEQDRKRDLLFEACSSVMCACCLFMKPDAFQEEAEFRFVMIPGMRSGYDVHFRKRGDEYIAYIQIPEDGYDLGRAPHSFPLKTVIIGPRSKEMIGITNMLSLKQLKSEAAGAPGVEVKKSAVTYR